MSPDIEFLAVVFSFALATIPWAFSIHAKVAIIAHSVETLPELFTELKERLDSHEDRLNKHEEEITSIKSKATPGD
jgi:hypothetical protein|tara:strand:+ start:744 stop:971 length:228 start_codon:yes stop_codon:yes gene_type:complete